VLYCLGATATTLTATGTNLKWYLVSSGGSFSITPPTPITTIDGTVTYYVSQSNSFPCESARALLNVRTNTKPKVSITAATDPKFFVCPGNSLMLKTIVSPYGISYKWQLASVDIAGANKDSFAAITDGVYRVIVSNAPNCNDTASVKVDQDTSLGKTSINPTEVNICDGVFIKLFSTTSLGTGYKFQWLKDGLPLVLDTLEEIIVSNKGNYQLKVTNNLGCSVVSNISAVNKFASISKPKISQLGSVLSVAAAYSKYQWYRNGKPLIGVNTSSINISFDGTYFVAVNDVNGCGSESDTVNIQGLAISSFKNNKTYAVFPNPTSSQIFIESNIELHFELIDMFGRLIFEQNETNSIDLSPFADAVYVLRIFNSLGQIVGVEKVIKSSK
jgi:hypothetical protein